VRYAQGKQAATASGVLAIEGRRVVREAP